MLEIRHITFDVIVDIWTNYLWPNRVSAIEPHSLIKYNSYPYAYDITYTNTIPIFFGLYLHNKLIGVNSGHRTNNSFRSRGLYVFDYYRGNGYGSILLLETIKFAKESMTEYVWSMPRYSAISTYTSAGFKQSSDWFPTETSEKNTYVIYNNSECDNTK
jgi:GNAT superfamily N-acetyltransferase